MRVLIAATMAASLFATSLLAAEAVKPLAPGKAAGVKKAQAIDNAWWYLLGAGAIGALAAGAFSQENRTGAVVVPATTGTST